MHWLARATLAAALALGIAASAATAKTRTAIIYKHKAWTVQVVAPDHAPSQLVCVAQLRRANAMFSIWANGIAPVQIQFYSATWKMRRGRTTLRLLIDLRPPWTLANAQTDKASILFELSQSGSGKGLLRDIMEGRRLTLRTRAGARLQSWDLAGSRAALMSLIKCTKSLRASGPKSP